MRKTLSQAPTRASNPVMKLAGARQKLHKQVSRLFKLLSDQLSSRRFVKTINSRHWGPSVLVTGRVIAHPWEYYVRRRALGRVLTASPALTIDDAAGFSTFTASRFKEASVVRDLCERIYEERRDRVVQPSGSATKMKKADYLVELLTDDDLLRYPQLVDFCLSQFVVEAVSRYLGTLPVLRRVGLLLSLPAPTDADSRLFHLDPEDTRQVKIFINVGDVQQGQGPFTFLPADRSATVLEEIRHKDRQAGKPGLRYRRWSDEEVYARCKPEDFVQLAGPPGTGVFVDTSRCLHFGSRMEPGTYRLVFMAQYLRYHFAFPTDANRVDAARAGKDPLRSRILVHRPGPTPFGAPPVLRH